MFGKGGFLDKATRSIDKSSSRILGLDERHKISHMMNQDSSRHKSAMNDFKGRVPNSTNSSEIYRLPIVQSTQEPLSSENVEATQKQDIQRANSISSDIKISTYLKNTQNIAKLEISDINLHELPISPVQKTLPSSQALQNSQQTTEEQVIKVIPVAMSTLETTQENSTLKKEASQEARLERSSIEETKIPVPPADDLKVAPTQTGKYHFSKEYNDNLSNESFEQIRAIVADRACESDKHVIIINNIIESENMEQLLNCLATNSELLNNLELVCVILGDYDIG